MMLLPLRWTPARPWWAQLRVVPGLRMSARAWMVTVSLLALLPMLAFALAAVWQLLQHQEQQSRAALQRRAAVGADAVAGELHSIAAQLKVAAMSKLEQQRDLAGLQALALRMVGADPRLSGIALHDAAGRVVQATWLPGAEPRPGDSACGGPGPLESDQAVALPLHAGVRGGPQVLTLVLPLRGGQQQACTLRAQLRPQALNAVLAEQRWPADWTASVVDQSLAIVARSRAPQAWLGQPVTASLAAALRAGRSGVFDSDTKDGTVVLASAAAVPGTGWWVVVGQPKAALLSQARAALAGLLAAGLLSLALAVLAPLWLARRIGRQIRLAARHPASAAGGQVVELGLLHAHAARQARALQRAQRDALTGLAGRAQFMAHAQARLDSLAQAPGHGMALLFVDLDGFKQVNDQRGHDAGDALLVAVAGVLQATARAEDVLGRLGGDEFVLAVAAPAHHLAAVSQLVAHRVRRGVAALDLALGCSVGVAHVRPGESLAELVARADQAMLAAKRRGRNRVVVV